MSATTAESSFARASAKGGAVRIDPVMVALALGIVLLGLVMVTSASISIASQASGEPFLYLERQLILTLLGAAAAALVFCLRLEQLERWSMPLLCSPPCCS